MRMELDRFRDLHVDIYVEFGKFEKRKKVVEEHRSGDESVDESVSVR